MFGNDISGAGAKELHSDLFNITSYGTDAKFRFKGQPKP